MAQTTLTTRMKFNYTKWNDLTVKSLDLEPLVQEQDLKKDNSKSKISSQESIQSQESLDGLISSHQSDDSE